MRYVVCHGEFAKGAQPFTSTSKIGVYVRNIGDPLPQSKAADILDGAVDPTHWLEQKDCPELRLTQLTHREWFALNQAMGSKLHQLNPHFLSAETTLSKLVSELDEDELRMICCTEGGPTVTHRSDLVEPNKAEQRATALVNARRRSAADAKDYIARLGVGSRAFWLGDDVIYGVMTEWAVNELPAITDDVDSWVDTISYLMVLPDLADALYDGAVKEFPGFGAGTRDRIDKINGYLRAWPSCLYWLARVHAGDERFAAVRAYLDQPLGGVPQIRDYNKIFLTELLPVQRLAEAVVADNVGSWHAYLTALEKLGQDNQKALSTLVNVNEYPVFMAHVAKGWPDFDVTWATVVASYPDTVARILRASTDPQLQALINRYSAASQVQSQPAQPVTVDVPPTTQTTASNVVRIQCGHCGESKDHRPVEAMDTGSRTCACCGHAIGASDESAAFECATCSTVAVAHPACLMTMAEQ